MDAVAVWQVLVDQGLLEPVSSGFRVPPFAWVSGSIGAFLVASLFVYRDLHAKHDALKRAVDDDWEDRFARFQRGDLGMFVESCRNAYGRFVNYEGESLYSIAIDAEIPVDPSTGEVDEDLLSSQLWSFAQATFPEDEDRAGLMGEEASSFRRLRGRVKDEFVHTARLLGSSDVADEKIRSWTAHSHNWTVKVLLYLEVALSIRLGTYPPGPKFKRLVKLADHIDGRRR